MIKLERLWNEAQMASLIKGLLCERHGKGNRVGQHAT